MVDTYTITYTNGNTTTFTVTNGEDSNIPTSDYEALKQEVEDLMNNQLTDTPTIATSYHITDSAKARFRRFLPEGHSEQETTEGNNKFNINNVTSVAYGTLSNGVITTDVNSGQYSLNVIISYSDIVLPAGTYYISLDAKRETGTLEFSKINNGVIDWISVTKPSLSSNYQRYVYKNTYSEEITLKKILIQFTGIGSASIKNIMISSENGEYEKFTYGASPNPNYEQPIKSAGDNGSITEKIVNKSWNTSELENGQWSNATGNPLPTANYVRSKDFIKVPSNKRCVVSSNASGLTYTVAKFDKDKKFISAGNSPTNIQDTVEYIKISIHDTTDLTLKVQIELSDSQDMVATDYVPHEEQTYSVYTQQPFRSIGDVRDVFFKNTVDSPYYDSTLTLNGWYERHNIGKYVFTGNEGVWTRAYSSTYQRAYFYNKITENLAKASCELMSNYFLDGSKVDDRTIDDCITMASNSNVCIYADQYSTIEALKTWLSSNNVELYYEAKNPTNLPCTSEQIQQLENRPSTYKTETNVNSEDEIEAYLDTEYVIDLKTYIDNN